MSGRRRRDNGWDGGSRDAQDNRRDPWADSSVDDWGDRETGQSDDAHWPAAPGGQSDGYRSAGAAGFADGRAAGPGGTRSGSYDDERGPGYRAPGARPGGASGREEPGYGGGQRDTSYGGRGANGGYPGPGHPGTASYGRGEPAPGRREPSVFEPARGGTGGYAAPAYDQPGYGSGGQRNGSGYDAPGYRGGRPGPAPQLPEFTPAGNDDADDDGPAGTPRPIGRLSIYTLHEDKAKEFDVLAERAAEGVRTAEPDTLVYVIHVVPKAPLQRIMYEIYRDRAAFLSHERQPHIRQFAADRASCVVATNVIDLRLKYAKVAALGGAPDVPAAPAAPADWSRRPADPAGAGGRSGASGSHRTPQFASAQPQRPQFSPATQYTGSEPPTVGRPVAHVPGRTRQVSAFPDPVAPPGGQQARERQATAQGGAAQPAASFTPARDRYPAGPRQHAATGREDYPSIAAYDNAANGGDYGGSSQYGAPTGYSPAARYANGGSYPSANGYQSANGYFDDNGYQGANDYSGSSSYRSANGYPGSNGYRGTNDYPDTSGHSGAGGYRDGGGRSRGPGSDYSGDAGQGYAAAGAYPGTGTHGAQYTPRYRELTSGPSPALNRGDRPDDGGRYGDADRGSSRSAEHAQRAQDQRLADAAGTHHASVPPWVPSVR